MEVSKEFVEWLEQVLVRSKDCPSEGELNDFLNDLRALEPGDTFQFEVALDEESDE